MADVQLSEFNISPWGFPDAWTKIGTIRHRVGQFPKLIYVFAKAVNEGGKVDWYVAVALGDAQALQLPPKIINAAWDVVHAHQRQEQSAAEPDVAQDDKLDV